MTNNISIKPVLGADEIEKNKKHKRLTLLVWITIGIFLLLEIILGENIRTSNGLRLMQNGQCFKFLGCNNGFFGYDALVHFCAGIFEAPLIIWLFNKYYHINLFHKTGGSNFWKNVFILIALLVLVAFSWETIELCVDQFRIQILHQVLVVYGQFNHLAQATNIDTMGDMFFSTLGGIISGYIYKKII
jgi:hypothetical protein